MISSYHGFNHTGFLPTQFNPNEVLLRSSDTLRTKLVS